MAPAYRRFNHSITILLATVCLLQMSGCNKKSESATQTVALVDGEEISVHQINNVLAKANGLSSAQMPQAKIDILEGLIDQQLAINAATRDKLDRTPDVVTAIESAKREILARAALEQIRNTQPSPTESEAKAYFDAHPELFAERRIFKLQELALAKSQPNLNAVKEKVGSAKSIEEIASWLTQNAIEFRPNVGTRFAEQIPLEVLPQLHQYQDGHIGMIEGNDAIFVFRVAASKKAPVALEQALPRIKTFLFNQRGAELIKREKAAWKAKAKIEYRGEFAAGAAALKAKTGTETPNQPVAKQEPAGKIDSTNLEKGMKGLK